MLGNPQVGKSSLMYKYVSGRFDEDYVVTLGVNFMEKTVQLRNADITFTIWDLGGQEEFKSMMPLCCNDAMAILFLFDLTRPSTLWAVKEWFTQSRAFNRAATPLLVGTKYDLFADRVSPEEQRKTVAQAKRFAQAMKAPLVFTSAAEGINVQKLFKVLLTKVFDLSCNLQEIGAAGDDEVVPVLLFESSGN